MNLNFDSIILYVQNPVRLAAFYTDVLHLFIIETAGSDWVLLAAGSANIGLHRIGDRYAHNFRKGQRFDNNTKIVFIIQNDLTRMRQELLAQNVPMREIKTFDNYPFWLCDGEDPEGNVFQLKQPKHV
jgi:hypothetical protein